MLNPVRGIVFDLDGTLADSLSMTFDAFNHAFVALGGRQMTPHEIMAHFGPGEIEIFARILGRDKADKAFEISTKYTDEHMGRVPLFAGVPELLEKLSRARIPVSIFTGRSWDTAEMILRHHSLLNRFVTVVCHDHVSQSKPSPEGLQLCLKRMSLNPSEVLMVGDHPTDMLAARSAGARGVAALWDQLANRKNLEPHQPAHFAENPLDVWNFAFGN